MKGRMADELELRAGFLGAFPRIPRTLGNGLAGGILALALAVVGFGGMGVTSARAGGTAEESRERREAPAQVAKPHAPLLYPVDCLNRPYPFTPQFVWRAMFPGIHDRIEVERLVQGVPGVAAQELAYHRDALLRPRHFVREVGRVIDTGRRYVGGGWTYFETTRGIVWVYNPCLDPWVASQAPANRSITQEIEADLDCELGREAPGYYDANGFMVSKGDPSAVRLVGKGRVRR